MSDDQARYLAACHAMQTGVLLEISHDEVWGTTESAASPKHLRTGVNSALVETGAIVGLLIEKGVITEEEWFKALADNMEREVKKYESKLPGVKLG